MLKVIARRRSNTHFQYNHQYHHHSKTITLAPRRHAHINTTSKFSHRYKETQIKDAKKTELSLLPLSHLLRNIIISTTCSSPTFSNFSYRILKWMLDSSKKPHRQFGGERFSPLIKWILKNTLYAHFCAGENRAEIRKTLKDLKALRYDGVILEYALEVLDTGEQGRNEGIRDGSAVDKNNKAIATWKRGMLETVDMLEPGNFVGLKSVLFYSSV